jgi:flagellin
MAVVDITRIANNIGALNALSALQTVNQTLAARQTRLSSGLRRGAAADEATFSADALRQQTLAATQTSGGAAALDPATSVQALLTQLRTQAAAVEAAQVGSTTAGQSTQATNAAATVQPGDPASQDAALNALKASLADLDTRFTSTEESLVTRATTEAAYTRIMNDTLAEEQLNVNRYMLLQQTATTMLAQANQAPQFLLSLFR